jgi:hypothetical protein
MLNMNYANNMNVVTVSCIVASCCTVAPPEDGCMEPKHVEEEQEI